MVHPRCFGVCYGRGHPVPQPTRACIRPICSGHGAHPRHPSDRHSLDASDLGIARFYERIGNQEGRVYHAERARELALSAGDEPLADAADLLMAERESADS